jgi:hypothetical protein
MKLIYLKGCLHLLVYMPDIKYQIKANLHIINQTNISI